MQVDILLHCRWLLPIAPLNSVLENYSLAIHAGRIVGLVPVNQAQQLWQADENIYLNNHIIMPGLINAHTHAPMNLLRGLADDLPFMEWLAEHILPAEKHILNAEAIVDGTNLAILEMLRSGITCFCDHYYFHDVIAKAAITCGMRSCVGLWVGTLPTTWGQSEADYLIKAEAALQAGPPHELIRWVLAPHSPYLVSETGFKKIKELADKFDVPIHIHLHESQSEILQCLKKYNLRPLDWLFRQGLLSPNLIAVHMTQLTDTDIELVKSTGIKIVHCPQSNLKLMNGFAFGLIKLLQEKYPIALGTDSAASNNDLDMFAELQTVSLIAKAISQQANILSVLPALEMITLNGARAFGLEKEIGSLEPGKAADIIAIDLSSYLTQPIFNPASHLVYALNRLQVSDVWIAGKRLLANGEFTQLDSSQIVAKANYWAKKIFPYRFPR